MQLMPAPDNLTSWLVPGDLLLYRSSGVFAWAIRVKSWSRVNHCETYMGKGIAYAARGDGVRSYPLRRAGLYAVLRPEGVFDIAKAVTWFNSSAVGQAYDHLGLFRFFTLGKPSLNKQFCSELSTRLYRAAGIEPFAADWDADLISPGNYLMSPHFRELWCAHDLDV